MDVTGKEALHYVTDLNRWGIQTIAHFERGTDDETERCTLTDYAGLVWDVLQHISVHGLDGTIKGWIADEGPNGGPSGERLTGLCLFNPNATGHGRTRYVVSYAEGAPR